MINKTTIFAIALLTGSSASSHDLDPHFLDIDEEALFDIVPGDNSLPSCSEDCVPEFIFDEDVWYCDTVEGVDPDTGEEVRGEICRQGAE